MAYKPPAADEVTARGEFLDCPEGSTAQGRFCYRAHPYQHSWYDAEHNCQKWGHGHLASIHDPQENRFVQDLILAKIQANPAGNIVAWIGGHLQGGSRLFCVLKFFLEKG